MRAGALRAVRTAGLAALTLAACAQPPAGVSPGEPVPAYSASALDGTPLALRELRGEVVLLNVWATWCFPCRREMPAFEELHRELSGHGLRVVGVSIDAAGARRDVLDFIDEFDLTFDILHDPAATIRRTFRTTGVPETFLIGADGRLLRHWKGRIDPHAPGVRGAVDAALQAPPHRPVARARPD
jgi:cytochrome c biogenesis protein CcmG, thiol:disulfide interchange protein DsbE